MLDSESLWQRTARNLKVMLNVFSSTMDNKHFLITWTNINCHYWQPFQAQVSLSSNKFWPARKTPCISSTNIRCLLGNGSDYGPLGVTHSNLTSWHQQIGRAICLSLHLRLMQLQTLHKVWMSYAVYNTVIIKGTSKLPELNQQPCHEHTWERGGTVPHTLTSAVCDEKSVSPPSHSNHRENKPPLPIGHRLGGLQFPTEYCRNVENLLPWPQNEPKFLGHWGLSTVTYPNELLGSQMSEVSVK